jgi:hypothetical protein
LYTQKKGINIVTEVNKRDPHKIARTVQEKVKKWEREAKLRDLAEKITEGTPGAWTRGSGPTGRTEAEWLAEAAALTNDPTAAEPDPTADLLLRTPDPQLAGWLMADWLLEERNLDGKEAGRPKWCLLCGKRGRDMRDAQDHTSDCGVGMWLLGVGKLNREEGKR